MVNYGFFAFVILFQSLVDFVAEYETEGAIQFRKTVNRANMLRDRGAATKTVEALIEDVTVLDVSTDISSRATFIYARGESFPALGIGGFLHLASSPIVHGMISKTFDIVGGVSSLTLVSHGVGVAGVDMRAVVNIDTEVFVILIVSIVANEGHYVLCRCGTAEAPTISGLHISVHLVGPIVGLHFSFIVRWAAECSCLKDLIEPKSVVYRVFAYLLDSPISFLTLCYHARCSE